MPPALPDGRRPTSGGRSRIARGRARPVDSRKVDIELPLDLPERRSGARAGWTRAVPTEASSAKDLVYRRRLRVEEALRQEQRNSPDAYKRTPGGY
jgi:hypothetical protein